MLYELVNTRKETVTVDGLGVLPPGATVVDEVRAENFRNSRGLTLAQAGMPKGVEVTVVVLADDDEKVN